MPELPEIETLRQELAPALTGQRIQRVQAYRAGLREPFPPAALSLRNVIVEEVSRRSKYLRLVTTRGSLLIHLGMSGQLRLVPKNTPRATHDHLDIHLSNGTTLRLRDPRRFGAVFWETKGTLHPRLSNLGPEPLTSGFTASGLHSQALTRKTPVKTLLMDASIVVGVGNIYASEALFSAGILPTRAANTLTRLECQSLVRRVRQVLRRGIRLGGSSMRDYVHADGSQGGFLSQAKVYGRAGQPCLVCDQAIASQVIGGRNSFWCPRCQS